MKSKNKMYFIGIIYTLMMAIIMIINFKFFKISYTDNNFIMNLFPFLCCLSVFTFFVVKKYFVELDIRYKTCKEFFLVFLPVILIAIFTIYEKFEISKSFLLPLFSTLLVGINEELIYRGVIFGNFRKEKSLLSSVFLSALLFSLMHSVNTFGGLALNSMIGQLVNTFFAGIFFAITYYATKNIYLMIIYHFLWDYIAVSNIMILYPYIKFIVHAIIVLEVIVSIILLKKYVKKIN